MAEQTGATAGCETVIGLEVHVELGTRSKIFCACPTAFGAEPNTQVCPICLGHPGVLPVLNQEALEFAVKAALALNCRVAEYSKFDRKNYVYPDLPKAYQISQYDLPLATDGWLEIEGPAGVRRVRIRRIHLEEDAGKLLHAGDDVAAAHTSLVDFNRCGVPLVEIVTEPDLTSAEEARLFLEKLRSVIQYTGVSDVKMEEGSLRCDVNVSVRPTGSDILGTRSELKNVNSFRSVVRGIEYEAARQVRLLQRGGVVEQETRSWSEQKGVSVVLRSKEEAHDYRYFPEPDLPPVLVSAAWRQELADQLPELPDSRRQRLVHSLGLSPYDAAVIVQYREIADFFDQALATWAGGRTDRSDAAKTVANWVINDLLRVMNEKSLEPQAIPITPQQLAALLTEVDKGTITGKIARTVFDEMCATGRDAAQIIAAEGLVQIADRDALLAVVAEAVAAHPKVVEDYARGKDASAQFFVGQVMKATRGRANPGLALQLIKAKLQELTGRE